MAHFCSFLFSSKGALFLYCLFVSFYSLQPGNMIQNELQDTLRQMHDVPKLLFQILFNPKMAPIVVSAFHAFAAIAVYRSIQQLQKIITLVYLAFVLSISTFWFNIPRLLLQEQSEAYQRQAIHLVVLSIFIGALDLPKLDITKTQVQSINVQKTEKEDINQQTQKKSKKSKNE